MIYWNYCKLHWFRGHSEFPTEFSHLKKDIRYQLTLITRMYLSGRMHLYLTLIACLLFYHL